MNVKPAKSVSAGEAANLSGAPAAFQLRTILVPIDFSPCSIKAIEYAVPFARQFNAALVFLFVVRRHGVEGGGGDAMLAADLAHAAQRLSVLAREHIPTGLTVRTEVRHGVESVEIAGVARRLEADLIVISTHGRTGRAHALAGSVAENVVQLATCPVLVVREHEHDFVRTATRSEYPAAPNKTFTQSTQAV